MALRRASCVMLMLVLVCMTSLAYAAEEQNAGNGGLLPVIPMGQGDSCVEDTDFMRRNHMDLLQHQRDETMKEGIRGKPYSLKECLSCHAVNGPDAIPVTVSSPKHFCRSCHDYAAVSIDCFQCHASRPEVQ
jgi:[DsrC]-trisulfide reductase subunit J